MKILFTILVGFSAEGNLFLICQFHVANEKINNTLRSQRSLR